MNVLTLHDIEGEARVLDTDLALQLGMTEPRFIRKDLIEANRSELEGFGILREVPTNTGQRGRPGRSFYLNEEQAVLVVMFSRTSKAAEARREVIRVFTAWRRGELTPRRPAPSLKHPEMDGLSAMAEAIKMLAENQREMKVASRHLCRAPHAC